MSDTPQSHDLPLKGVTVLELSTMVSASLATMILASQGANVIKIEPVGTGDPMRSLGTQKSGISALFANCNRGKKSLAVDLKSEEGCDLVRTLARRADVLIHNYRPGVMDKLTLGSERLRIDNPKLIYVSVTGFGSTGPMASAPAYDHVVQGLAGFTGIQSDSPEPKFMKTLIVDKVTAYTATQAITAALLARASSGKGRHIDVSMLQSGLFFLFPDGMMNETLKDDDVIVTPSIADGFVAVKTSDGYLAMAPSTDKHWIGIGHAIGREDVATDPKFTTMLGRSQNHVELLEIVLTAIAQMETDKAIVEFRKHDVPCAPCLSPSETLAHEQVSAIGAISHTDHPILGSMIVAHPAVQFAGRDATMDLPCSSLGQHSEEIARSVGFSDDQISQMRSEGALGGLAR